MAKKIVIAGIGGVGGYFGGLLAKAYQDSDVAEVYFLARGKHLATIKSEGLKVLDDQKEFIAFPKLVSNKAQEFGVVDFILFCTKTYGLEAIAHQLVPCINEKTVLIPLQNGVDSRETLLKTFPGNLVTHGCVYLISRREKPGVIVKKGQVGSFFFGLPETQDGRLSVLQAILLQAGIKSNLSEDIERIIWEKFIFLSSIATATTYFDATIQEILEDTAKRQALESLIHEVTALAIYRAIAVGEDQVERVMDILTPLPPGATSSMHSDFKNQNRQTELESLTGYVVREGHVQNVSVNTFEKMYAGIKS